LKIIYSASDARAGLLKRSPVELQETSAGLKQRIKEVFGKELTLQEVVEQILEEVRKKGDLALFEYGRRLDGSCQGEPRAYLGTGIGSSENQDFSPQLEESELGRLRRGRSGAMDAPAGHSGRVCARRQGILSFNCADDCHPG
jgi:hypothetical protein